MLMENQMIPVKIKNKKQLQWYFSKGYECNIGDEICVNAKDLTKTTKQSVYVLCDYCLEEGIETIVEKKYETYIKQNKKSIVQKDCCKNCTRKKVIESNQIKYGVNSTSQLHDIKEKQKQKCIEKYGVEYFSQTNEYKEKYKKTMQNKYGVDNAFQSEEVKEKIKQTNIEKYGVDYYTQTDECQDKIKQTCLERYGTTSPMQNEEVKNKGIKTNLKRYGCENVFQNEEIRNKYKQTIIEKYGVEHISQTEDFKIAYKQTCLDKYGVDHPLKLHKFIEKIERTNMERYGVDYYTQTDEYKIREQKTNLEKYGTIWSAQSSIVRTKINETLNKNNTVAVSTQQKYINNLLDGGLNYYTGKCFLDIAFPEEMVYIEYDGGGHDLDVKLGRISEQDFKNKDMRRYYALKSQGWREIRIISDKDLLPSDDIIIKLINQGKEYLNSGHSWIEFNIDENIVRSSIFEKSYNYGKLRQIKEENLNNIPTPTKM
jgi:very-short-patch-repair endonuclease